MRLCEVDVAPPHPGAALPVMVHKGKGLGIMDDDHVVVEVVADSVLVDGVLVDLLLARCEVDRPALKGIVELLRDAEKVRGTLDHPPAGLNPYIVHKKGERRKEGSDSTPVIDGVHMGHVEAPQGSGLFPDSRHDLFPHNGNVIVKRNNPARHASS